MVPLGMCAVSYERCTPVVACVAHGLVCCARPCQTGPSSLRRSGPCPWGALHPRGRCAYQPGIYIYIHIYIYTYIYISTYIHFYYYIYIYKCIYHGCDGAARARRVRAASGDQAPARRGRRIPGQGAPTNPVIRLVACVARI